MNMTKDEYNSYVMSKAEKSPLLKDVFFAFIIGGGICVFGEFLSKFFKSFDLPEKTVSTLTCVTIIVIAGILTGLDIFPKIAKVAGAGTVVPITGFANAVVSPAIEAHSEGIVLGVGAKLFTIAGPVILFSTLSSFVCGIVFYLVKIL